MSWVHRTLITAAAHAPLARVLAEGIAGQPGEGMWLTELSETGAEPATHYISHGWISPEMAALLGDAPATYQAAQASGAQVTLAQIEALYANSVIRESQPEDAQAILDSLGLQMVRREL